MTDKLDGKLNIKDDKTEGCNWSRIESDVCRVDEENVFLKELLWRKL